MVNTFKYIGIETTTKCNTKCAVCPRHTNYNYRFTTMSMDLFKKIICDISDNHEIKNYVIFGGMGDAAVDKLLIERLRFMKEAAPTLKVALSSNMAAWKDLYTDAIVEEQLAFQMRFSILAFFENSSEKMYSRTDHVIKARKAIDYFIQKNEAVGHPIRLEVYTLKLQDEDPDVEAIKERYWDKVNEFEVWKPHSWSNLLPDLRSVQAERRPCVSVEGLKQPLIGINGDVIPCSMDINYTLSLGSMKDSTLEQIISGDKAKRLQQLNRDRQIETLSTCNGCVYLNADASDVLVESKTSYRHLDRQHTDEPA